MWPTPSSVTNAENTLRFFSTLAASTLGTLVALVLVMFIGFMFMAALVATTGSSSTTKVRTGTVLEIHLSGTIPELASNDPFEELFDLSSRYDLAGFTSGLKKAADDDRIEAVWLRTGGMFAPWSTLQEVRQALLAFKESGKPVIASSGESFMTERDYFLASVADEVYAAPGSFFEFNGLYAQTFYYKGLMDKLGIEPTIVRAGSFKSAVEPFTRTDMSEESRLQLGALLDTHSDVLTTAIAESRDTTAAYVEALMREDAFITVEGAKHAGLLDGLLFDEAVEEEIKARIDSTDGGDLRTVRLRSYVDAPAAGPRSSNEGAIGIVYAVGTIMSGRSSYGGGTLGSATFNRAMEKVREDDHVKAVVLRINSPGGSAVASDAMWQAIDQTAQVKPVIVSMGDLAASGGYWIATAGDTIVADPVTITGSIGVYGMHFSIGEMLDSKLGVSFDHVATSDYADMFSGLRPLRPVEEAMLGSVIDSTYADFLELVADSRGLDVDAVHDIAQGRVWSGADALEIGLVDLLGGMDVAIGIAADKAGLEEGTYSIMRLPRPKSLFEELEDAFMVRAARVLGISPGPLGSARLRTHQELIEEVVRMQGVPQARMLLDVTIQ